MTATHRGVRLGDSGVPPVSLAGAKRQPWRAPNWCSLNVNIPNLIGVGASSRNALLVPFEVPAKNRFLPKAAIAVVPFATVTQPNPVSIHCV